MFLSMNWIGDFVDLSGLDRKALIRRFTLATAEVEDIIEKGADTHGVVVAQIRRIENHPNSKKLHLLKLDVGEAEDIDCVCGAPNVREGMKVAFVRAGGSVCGHSITDATVAGYPSHGMCCSEAELGISADGSGLMEVEGDAKPGTDIKTLYDIDDIIFEVDNKSLTNRPDLWGHYGIAREFATLADRPLKAPDTADLSACDSLPPVSVRIDEPSLCLRYSALKIDGVTLKKSPVNMRIRLFYCGSRAINFPADLTNYVMMELGQPLHAFDRRRVDCVEVKRFSEPFDFRTLDGVERHIDPQTLMICSSEKPVAVAGIMGGYDSEIEDDTTSFLLESACFDAVSVRKSSTRLGLRTDASMRYEKTLDPEMTRTAAARVLWLISLYCPSAAPVSCFTDVYPTHFPEITLEIDKRFVDRYTGIDISCDRIEKTLVSLGFVTKRQGESFEVRVPSWRSTKDVTIKADLIEEITRIYGYDNFTLDTASATLHPVRAEQFKSDEYEAKDLMVLRYGLNEVHSYLWADTAKDKALGIETPENVRLINAQTPDHATLRRTMIPTLLSFVSENRGYADRYGIFEIGHVVEGKSEDGTCRERRHLGVVLYSRTESEQTLFLHMRDMINELAQRMRHITPAYERTEKPYSYCHPANTFDIFFGQTGVGTLCCLHPAVRENLDRKCACVCFELDMDTLAQVPAQPLLYREPSRFPSIEIDLSFFANVGEVNYEKLSAAAQSACGELLCDMKIADLYGEGDSESVTFRLTFASHDRTLSKAELQDNISAVISGFEAQGLKFKAV